MSTKISNRRVCIGEILRSQAIFRGEVVQMRHVRAADHLRIAVILFNDEENTDSMREAQNRDSPTPSKSLMTFTFIDGGAEDRAGRLP